MVSGSILRFVICADLHNKFQNLNGISFNRVRKFDEFNNVKPALPQFDF